MKNRYELLFEAGVHYGHRTRSWNPKMKPFIWGEKDGIHLINVAITEIQLTKAEELLKNVAASGLPILWVGTKKVARASIIKNAQESDSPYFSERWVGGTLTNYHEVKKSIKNMLYNKEILEKSTGVLTKKELGIIKKKIEKAEKGIGGIQKLSWPIGALIIADVKRDAVAVREAVSMGIPVVALVDTNCSPEGINVVIPANDDLEKSIEIISSYLSKAIKIGKEEFLKKNPEKVTFQKLNNEEDKKGKKEKPFAGLDKPKKKDDTENLLNKKVEVLSEKNEVKKETSLKIEKDDKKKVFSKKTFTSTKKKDDASLPLKKEIKVKTTIAQTQKKPKISLKKNAELSASSDLKVDGKTLKKS